jgi:general secretion pathway protein J
MTRFRRAPAPPGFTLLEIVIALAIVGALLAIAFGGLRVAVTAWRRGEDRAEVHQHARTLMAVLARSIGSAYPYRIAATQTPEPIVQFDGYGDRLAFVTRAAPFPLGVTIAFTAVSLSLDTGDEPGLVVSERALPNQDIWTKATPVLRDPEVTALHFRYLRPEGDWEDRWDGRAELALPAAVEVTVTTSLQGRASALPPVTIGLRTLKPPAS